MSIVSKIKTQLGINSMLAGAVQRVREDTGVYTLTERDVRELAAWAFKVSNSGESKNTNTWHALAVQVLGEAAAKRSYTEVIEQLPGHPTAAVLHEWGVLPQLHAVLVSSEERGGPASRRAANIVRDKLAKLIPSNAQDWIEDISLLTALR